MFSSFGTRYHASISCQVRENMEELRERVKFVDLTRDRLEQRYKPPDRSNHHLVQQWVCSAG